MKIFEMLGARKKLAEERAFSQKNDLIKFVATMPDADDLSEVDLVKRIESIEKGLDSTGMTREDLAQAVENFKQRKVLLQQMVDGKAAKEELDRVTLAVEREVVEYQRVSAEYQQRLDKLKANNPTLGSRVANGEHARQQLIERCRDERILGRIRELNEQRKPLVERSGSLGNRLSEIQQDLDFNERIIEGGDDVSEQGRRNHAVVAGQKSDMARFGAERNDLLAELKRIDAELAELQASRLTSEF